MKILIFSDSHGNDSFMRKALALHPDAEAVFHLGDGAREFLSLAETDATRAYFCVRGNCDFALNDATYSSCVDLGAARFFLTHGHLFPFPDLIKAASEADADAALFGHTHRRYLSFLPDERKGKGLYLFNPGSVSKPRDRGGPSYGLVEARDHQFLFSHGECV